MFHIIEICKTELFLSSIFLQLEYFFFPFKLQQNSLMTKLKGTRKLFVIRVLHYNRVSWNISNCCFVSKEKDLQYIDSAKEALI